MARTLDDGMRSVLQRMQRGTLWKMAREIGADSTQYVWLLRHGLIVRRDAGRNSGALRWEYRLTRAGEAAAAAAESEAADDEKTQA